MVVVRRSMRTLAGIANGYSSNLLLRSADVFLKQHKPLIIVPRETPKSLIHLENMVKFTIAGVIILPASPVFYHYPTTIDDLVKFINRRILDLLGVEHNFFSPDVENEEKCGSPGEIFEPQTSRTLVSGSKARYSRGIEPLLDRYTTGLRIDLQL